MATTPEKTIWYSLPESEPDSASQFPVLSQNEEDGSSKEMPPANPASPLENPNLPLNEGAHCNEEPLDDPSPSLEVNPNACADLNEEPSQKPLENPSLPPNQEAHCIEKPSDDSSPPLEKDPNTSTDLNKESVEKPLENPVTCSENKSHGAEERNLLPQVEGEAEMASGKDKTTAAASTVVRKLPNWSSNQNVEEEKGRRGKSKSQTEKKGNDLPVPNNLQEVIEALSGDFDWKRYSEMDLLEVAEMKGIVFENPSWWPPEGFPDSL